MGTKDPQDPRDRSARARVRGARVLIVAPTPGEIDDLAAPLIEAGADAVPCTTVDDALDVLARVRVDAVVASVEMRAECGGDLPSLARRVAKPQLPPPFVGVRRFGRSCRPPLHGDYARLLVTTGRPRGVVRAVASLLRTTHN